MKMLKNRNTQIALGVILLVVIGLGGYFFFANSNKPEEAPKASESTVKTLSPKDIGLKLEVSPDKKKIKFQIAKANGIKSIEYEMTYEADSTAQEQSDGSDARIQRGITGQADIQSGDSTYESEWLDLGSCSKNVCKYDTGVKSIDMTLKLTKSDGIYQVEDTVKL